MKIITAQKFIPAQFVDKHIPKDAKREYMEAGILVSARPEMKKDHYFSVESLETMVGSERIPAEIRTAAGRTRGYSGRQQKRLREILAAAESKHALFYTPVCMIKAQKEAGKKGTMRLPDDKKRELEDKRLLEGWCPAGSFFESLEHEIGHLPRTRYIGFIRAMYDQIGAHPFVNEEGIWHYTMKDIRKIRKNLDLPATPPAQHVPGPKGIDPREKVSFQY
ncbi:hypothetical protein ACFL96_14365 [Thermoproteota archaeon]